MSTSDCEVATALERECPVINDQHQIQRIDARVSDVGGIPVRRLLPHRARRLIGAWCFLDHAGPARFGEGDKGLQVGPHPHTCLQTFTWMIAGEVLHRDSLGYEQVIRPGQVNLMTAGRGISHTEQSVPGERDLHAVQLWIALPFEHRFVEPRFDHYPDLPRFDLGHLSATLLVGDFGGYQAPTLSFSPLLGMDLTWTSAGQHSLILRPEFEYGILPLETGLEVDGQALAVDQLAYLGTGRKQVDLKTSDAGRAMLIGGAPLDEDITIWWNFVAHSKADIEQAQADWENHSTRFGQVSGSQFPRLEPRPIPWK
jgi:quercetin 2,3-dioxygenase